MIAYLKGKIIKKSQRSVIVFTGGLGYEVFLSLKELEKTNIDQESEYFIYSHVKEDAFDLYGFEKYKELDFFKKLISVSGVGPRSAINVLALADIEDLKRAISSGQSDLLQQVAGIGKKTAERIVVELKEKFIDEISSSLEELVGNQQVVAALVSLGYKPSEAADLAKGLSSDGDLASRIKEALKRVNN
ncbi:MAG: Holliday junction branch migration protein RuvA [Patescibacteria group bacterium]|nr:Holliday junction branch migration protein RuvA [Patescibacteria group bacterium]